jgi:phosphoribosylformylglycinamidine synthase subunit PurQ / glutaminase
VTVAVIQFPGSNDDRDAVGALKFLGIDAKLVWHQETSLHGVDAVVLPGGFSYGDYLRCGAIARFAPIMEQVRAFADKGGPVLGICNGFQILCEAGLLPGALVRNSGLSFVCKPVTLRVEQGQRSYLDAPGGSLLTIPIKHGEGRYVVDNAEELEANGQVVLRYANADGTVGPEANPNGSTSGIAGVCNKQGNVFGLMPHPEHAVDPDLDFRSVDGALVLRALASSRVG